MLNRLFTILLFFCVLASHSQNILPARCPYKDIAVSDSRIKQADDFTITTTDGVTRNLYNTLDSGKTVFVDIFYTTCYYCQLYSPVIEEAYQETGAGEGDVEFWGISNNLFDTNWVIDQYKENYNVSNPCAGPWGGGLTAFSIIVNGQPFYGFPTYCVICPDRNIYFDVCYPPVAACFYPYFENCTVGVNDDLVNKAQPGIISVYPNPSSEGVFLDYYSKNPAPVIIGFYNLPGEKVTASTFDASSGFQTLFISTNQLQDGIYFMKIFQEGKMIGSQKILISR